MNEDEMERLRPLAEGHRPDTLKKIADRCNAAWEMGELAIKGGYIAGGIMAIAGLAVGLFVLILRHVGG